MKDQEVYREDIIVENEQFDIKKWLYRILKSWYWFAGCLVICLFAAWFYLHYTNPVYRAVASIMIKDDKKGGDISDNPILKELGIGSSKLVENEIEILRSYDLMEEVVKRQQLYVSYITEGRLRDVPLFGSDLPLAIEIFNQDSIEAYVQWKLSLRKQQIILTGLDEKKIQLSYGVTYFINGVRFQFLPNEAWGEQHRMDSSVAADLIIKIVPISSATGSYNRKLSVDPVSKLASVVSLSVTDPHKEKARLVLATLIDIYNRQGLDDKNKVTANTIDFLNERLRSVALDLQGVEGQVQKFKTENKITDISADAQQYMNMSKEIDMQKAESQTRLNIVSAMEKDLLLNQDSPSLVPSTLGLQEVSLASLVEKHNSLMLEKERVEKNKEIGPQNPLLIDLREQVREARKKLLLNVRNLKEAYQITLNDISRKNDQLIGRIGSVPQMEKKLVEIQRNRNVQEQLYAFLLQKREEAAVTLASNIADSRTIVRARSGGQISPQGQTIWAMALLAGLLIPFVFMLVSDFFNDRVGDAEEVEKKSTVPLLGSISHIRKIKSPIVISERSRSIVAEQIRTLRTAISFTGKGQEVKKILITSSQPGDGKSFVSINLAASFALLNKRTLIVEFDLRKPHVGRYLGIEAKHGLSAILTGKKSVDETLIEIPGFNGQLFLLPSGVLPPNPAEIISSSRMNEMMKELETKFDYIVIDTPPFGLVTDAVLLQQYADITLTVLRQGYTHKDVYAALGQRKIQKPEFPLYTVLNGVGWKRRYQRGYGYGTYGNYGYGKGKGYFAEDES